MRRTILGCLAASTLLVPGTASASTISVVDATTVVFTASPGEANDLDANWRFQPGLLFTDAGSTIGLAGEPSEFGCDALTGGILCDARLRVDALLGDQDDRARVRAVSTARVWGGPGNDEAVARGEGGQAIVYGESGDDVIEADGEGGVADGGPGDDVISAVWNVPTLRGGPGDDELRFWSNFDGPDIDGGAGDDRIFALWSRIPGIVRGGTGADEISLEYESRFSATGHAVDAGDGADAVRGGPDRDRIETGRGDDEVDVAGGGVDAVACGAGHDLVYADPDDDVALDCEVRRTERG